MEKTKKNRITKYDRLELALPLGTKDKALIVGKK